MCLESPNSDFLVCTQQALYRPSHPPGLLQFYFKIWLKKKKKQLQNIRDIIPGQASQLTDSVAMWFIHNAL